MTTKAGLACDGETSPIDLPKIDWIKVDPTQKWFEDGFRFLGALLVPMLTT